MTNDYYKGYQEPKKDPPVGFDALIEDLRELRRREAENLKMIHMVTKSVTTKTPHSD